MSTLFNLNIDSFLENFAGLRFCTYGPLHHPIKNHKIRFDPKGQIELTTVSDGISITNAVEHPPGTVRVNDDFAVLESYSGVKLELKGVQPFNSTRNTNYVIGIDEYVETSTVHEISGNLREQCVDDFQIEYVSNIEDNYLFPDSFDKKVVENTTINIKSDKHEFKIEDINKHNAFSRSALALQIGDIELYLVVTKDSGINDAVIIYKRVQSEEVRAKIRDCISFCLGKHLHTHGYLILDSKYRNVAFAYKSNYQKIRKDSYPALMPAPLGRAQMGLGSFETNRLVNAIYESYEKYNLRHVFWGYWHALDAPIHIAGVHFGACIEAFQSAYISHHSEDFSQKLVQEKSMWKAFREAAIKTTELLNIPGKELFILINKINNLNQTPQSVLTERFLTQLGIKLSELELSAWKERNNAAHGKSVNDGSFNLQIRNIKILKCLLHRMLLIATDGSDYYFDYYSYDFPVRLLTDSIVEPIT